MPRDAPAERGYDSDEVNQVRARPSHYGGERIKDGRELYACPVCVAAARRAYRTRDIMDTVCALDDDDELPHVVFASAAVFTKHLHRHHQTWGAESADYTIGARVHKQERDTSGGYWRRAGHENAHRYNAIFERLAATRVDPLEIRAFDHVAGDPNFAGSGRSGRSSSEGSSEGSSSGGSSSEGSSGSSSGGSSSGGSDTDGSDDAGDSGDAEDQSGDEEGESGVSEDDSAVSSDTDGSRNDGAMTRGDKAKLLAIRDKSYSRVGRRVWRNPRGDAAAAAAADEQSADADLEMPSAEEVLRQLRPDAADGNDSNEEDAVLLNTPDASRPRIASSAPVMLLDDDVDDDVLVPKARRVTRKRPR
jgi:hypothetical protein